MSFNGKKYDVNDEEILFISDIEQFEDDKLEKFNFILNKKNYKLIVLVGDILSFLSIDSPYWDIFKKSTTVCNLLEKDILKETMSELSPTKIVGRRFSEMIINGNVKLDNFFLFLDKCYKKKINVIFYSGNHDSILGARNIEEYSNFIDVPILNKLCIHGAIYFPKDLEMIKLKKSYLTGVSIFDEDWENDYSFPTLKEINSKLDYDSSLKELYKSTIFVSHIPGKEKFRKIGSTDITNFKKKYKFKYHYHGHVRNFNGEYFEGKTPTISCHLPENVGEFEDLNPKRLKLNNKGSNLDYLLNK